MTAIELISEQDVPPESGAVVQRVDGFAKRWARTLRKPLGIFTLAGLVVLLFLAVFAPILWGERASATDVTAILQQPSSHHWFGTDAAGRDVFLRVLVATRPSLLYGLETTAIAVVLGVFFGCLPVVAPRWLGRLVIAVTNMLLAFPYLLLVIPLVLILGEGAFGAVLGLGIAGAPFIARMCQTLAAGIAGRDYVNAARLLGANRLTLLTRHVVPNIADTLIVNATLMAASSVVGLSALSFLGLGVQPPGYDWGRMLNDGLSSIFTNPVIALGPAGAIVFAGLVITGLGDTLGAALNGTSHVQASRAENPAPSGAETPDSRAVETADAGGSGGSATNSILSVRDLKVSFPADGTANSAPTHYAVDGVSFEVAEGERVGIVGESGSGKSLTALAIAGLIERPGRVEADTLCFDGIDMVGTDLHKPETRRHLGLRLAMIFQDPMSSLNPVQRIGTQIAEVARLHGGMSRKSARDAAAQRLTEVAIDGGRDKLRQYPHEFSGGMRQRAMIAMGLMGSPRLLIADEPTTALDVTVQKQVMLLLDQVCRARQAAMLFISHDIALVTGVCTRILVMYRGQIVENISTTDLVAGRATHLYTRALIASIPTLETDRNVPLPAVEDFMNGTIS